MNKESNFVSAIVYVHNSKNSIENFLLSLISIFENNFEHSEIICVNDCSTDGSNEKIEEISKNVRTTCISIVNMSYFQGLELAMNAGTDISIGDYVFEFDSTLINYDASEILTVYRKCLEGYDVVCASSNQKQRLSSNLFYFILKHFANFSYDLYSESFHVLSRRVINRVSSMNQSIPYRKAIYANSGLRIERIKYDAKKDSKDQFDQLEQRYRRKLAVDVLILFTEVGYKFSITMTLVMMLITIFVAIYSCIAYFLVHPVAGWTTTILFLSVAFFGLFGIQTIIVKYLQLLVDLIFKRKRYSYESIQKLTK